MEKIKDYHHRSRGIYGSPKIHQDLIDEGEVCNVKRVARLMKVADIQSKLARKFVITTDSKNTLQPATDLLKREFVIGRKGVKSSNINKLYYADIWLYHFEANISVPGAMS